MTNSHAIRAALASSVIATLLVAGCSSAAKNKKESRRPSGDTRRLAAQLKAYYAGTDRALPASGPKAQSKKKVWVLSCSSAAPGCAIPANAAMRAGKAIGWNMTVVDGKFDPNVQSSQVRAAIAAHADALITVAVDCPAIAGPLQEAVNAHMKVMSVYGYDCNNSYNNGKSLYSAELSFGKDKNYEALIKDVVSRAIAGYIARSGDKPEIIEFRENDLLVARSIADGFDDRIKACANCTVRTVTFTGQDVVSASALQQKASAALTRYPNATVVMAPYDATILLGIGGAVEQARATGRHIVLTGGEGLAPNLELIKKGTQQFAVGLPAEWAGWAVVDGVNRLFAGAPQVDEGIGVKIVDATHPAGCRPFVAGKCVDYQAHYRALWGVN